MVVDNFVGTLGNEVELISSADVEIGSDPFGEDVVFVAKIFTEGFEKHGEEYFGVVDVDFDGVGDKLGVGKFEGAFDAVAREHPDSRRSGVELAEKKVESGLKVAERMSQSGIGRGLLRRKNGSAEPRSRAVRSENAVMDVGQRIRSRAGFHADCVVSTALKDAPFEL